MIDTFERWELEEQLRHVARVLGPEYLEQRRHAQHEATLNDDASWTDWLALAVGFCALIVGGVLCASEVWGRQVNLWKFGLAVALMGLAALAVGLWQPHAEMAPPGRPRKVIPQRGTRPRATARAAGSPGRRINR